jgi:hypothetical protein
MKTCVGSRHELQGSEPGNVGKEYGGVRKQVSDRRIVNFTPCRLRQTRMI